LASLALASCGGSGALADAKSSCAQVKIAIATQVKSEQPRLSSSRRAVLEAKALDQLLKATSLAAQATSQDGSWNPLMTTINEAERVPFANLIASLRRICAVADSSTPYLGS